MTEKVFILHHIHELPNGEDDVKFIGVYRTNQDALSAIERAKILPGFSECPDGFDIQEYQVGKDHWVDGYHTYIPGQE